MNPGDPVAPNPWTPPPTNNPWPTTPPAAPAEPATPTAREGEIISLVFNYSGTSQVESLFSPPAIWYNALEETFQWPGVGKQLGYQGAKTYDKGIVSFLTDEYAAGLFAWEAIAEYIIPKDKTFPIWEAYASNVLASYVDNVGDTYIVRDSVAEFRDGPTGQFMKQFGMSAGMTNKAAAIDAPRINGIFGSGRTFSFKGDWRLVVSTKVNAWQVKFQLEFSFSDSAPEQGAGSLTVLEQPHRV